VPGLFFLMVVVGGYGAFVYGDDKLRTFLKELGAGIVAVAALGWLLGRLGEWVRVVRHRVRLGQLQAFADSLGRGTVEGRGFFGGGTASVSGQFEGRAVELVLRLSGDPTLLCELRLPEGSHEFVATRPGILGRVLGPGPVVKARAARTQLDEPLRALLLEHGYARVSLGAGWLRAEKLLGMGDLRLERLLGVCRSLGRIARLSEPRRPTSGVHLAQSGAGERRCPFCRETLPADREGLMVCTECRTLHHADCFLEAGGCTVFGCQGARVRAGPVRGQK
jgi:hypothetical protein